MRKYRLPPTSDEFLRCTPEEMLIEFFEDWYLDHPDRQARTEVHERTDVEYHVTGDPLVDRWEREIAEGKEPDLDEAVPEGEREQSSVEPPDFEGIDEAFE